jgi:DNA mismatch repair protein MutL
MSQIQILNAEIANRIAAGEVVDRPASVVKELVDNAIDAGATRITVRIEKFGTSFIEVADNGSGMSKSDALLCLEQHATSKIKNTEDLDGIQTYGFRGEAIPSIASVSRFSISTRPHDQLEGTCVQVDGGQVRSVESIGCPPGTTIKVARLFFNVPARKKFLKSARTEEHHIQETFTQLAISRRDVHMELIIDGRCTYNAPPSEDLRFRLQAFMPRETLKNMLPINYSEAGVTVSGLCARPGMARGSSREQRFFINQRPIVALELSRAVRNAYDGLLSKGQFAPCVVFLSLDPHRIDINVHPAKREVRFREANLVSQITTHATSLALRSLSGETSQLIAPEFISPTEKEDIPVTTRISLDNTQLSSETPVLNSTITQPSPGNNEAPKHEFKPKMTLKVTHQENPSDNSEKPSITPPQAPTTTAGTPHIKPPTSHGINKLRFISPFKNQFLLCEGDKGLVVICIKAARERILFEQMLHNHKNNEQFVQPLLIPITLELARSDSYVIEKYQDNINQLGFSIRHFGGDSWLIDSVPANFPQDDIHGIFKQILDTLQENPDSLKREIEINLAKSISQVSSSRQKQRLDEDFARQLIDTLDKAETPYACPNGRPVFLNISENELLKRFGRS